MNIQTIEPHLIYKVIAGSKAYRLDLPTSDTDTRGIYIQPDSDIITGQQMPQVSDKTNDTTYYEFNRYMDLLAGSNPNILENLFVDKEFVLQADKDFEGIILKNRDLYLTKKILWTFGGYAISQIKKARGLNKKIVNPIDKERKDPLDFCYAIQKATGYMLPMKEWLKDLGFEQQYCGLSKMPNGDNLYKVFHGNPGDYRGIIYADSDDLRHSEVKEHTLPHCFMWYNKDGYSSYCKDYKEYWDWVNKRNPHRYNDNVNNKHNYDGKNMMHCLRMLDMAIEVAQGKGMRLLRPNRDFLLSVRHGQHPYERILELIEEKKIEMEDAFEKSDLPPRVNLARHRELILELREAKKFNVKTV